LLYVNASNRAHPSPFAPPPSPQTELPPIIAGMMGQANIDYSVIAASGFLSALPAVLLAVVFQRYMVQGLTAGSVKG